MLWVRSKDDGQNLFFAHEWPAKNEYSVTNKHGGKQKKGCPHEERASPKHLLMQEFYVP